MNEAPLDEAASRRIGMLLGQAGTSDVIDASVVDLVDPGDTVISSDLADLATLAIAAGKRIRLVTI